MKIHDLKSEKAQVYNGMQGEVFDFDELHGRWAVKLDKGGVMEFKAVNLTPLEPAPGIQSNKDDE